MNQRMIWGTLTGLGIFILTASAGEAVPMPSEHSNSTTQFRRIEQPLGLKAIITLGGLGLISLELWWFLFSQPTTKKAESDQGIQSLDISVDGGYEPALIVVKSGQLVRLNFFENIMSTVVWEQFCFQIFRLLKIYPLIKLQLLSLPLTSLGNIPLPVE